MGLKNSILDLPPSSSLDKLVRAFTAKDEAVMPCSTPHETKSSIVPPSPKAS